MMFFTHRALFCAILAVGSCLQIQVASAAQSEWAQLGPDGKLVYKTLPGGDRIVDFSYAGYGGGGVKLPVVPVQKTVEPSGGDDSAAIQAAIDAVSAMPMENGFRGTVLLAPGTFHCENPITISQNGIVLRGSGTGKDGTAIEMTGSPHTCVDIKGIVKAPRPNSTSAVSITDAYVPAGALGFSVKNAAELQVGDTISIQRTVTKSWIKFMKMDTLVRDKKPQAWMKGKITYERIIRAKEDSRLTLDVPLPDAIDTRFLSPGDATVVKIESSRRLAQCGLESLRIVSPPPSGTLAAKNNLAISLSNCEDCWVRDVDMHDALSNVKVMADARRITIKAVNAVHTATVAKGAGYPSDFTLVGSQTLIDRCSSSGDGSFYVATLSSSATLNVALNCKFEGKGAIQPHMRWSTALLIDSCNLPDGRIEFINRGTAGSGHGWAIGWAVAWNCTAKQFVIQQPPGAMNWAIGCKGPAVNQPQPGDINGENLPAGVFDLPEASVTPDSLYLAQLRERLGEQALTHIDY